MSTDEMRIAAANSVGWTLEKTNVHDGTCWHLNGIQSEIAPPDYDTSLDAVAELTKTLSIADCREGVFFVNEQGKFNSELGRIVERDMAGTKQEKFYFDIINATAIQRLEAYLITKGLWIVKE